MDISAARKELYDNVLKYHEDNAVDTRYYNTSLEEYFEKVLGGSRWDIPQEAYFEFKEYRQSLRQSVKFPD